MKQIAIACPIFCAFTFLGSSRWGHSFYFLNPPQLKIVVKKGTSSSKLTAQKVEQLEGWNWLQSIGERSQYCWDFERFFVRSKVNPQIGAQSWTWKVFFGAFFGLFSMVFRLSRPNRKHFWYTVSEKKMRLVDTNTLVKTDFEKVENSKSYEQKFGHFFTFVFTALRRNFLNFFNIVAHKIQVFAFNLNPVSWS